MTKLENEYERSKTLIGLIFELLKMDDEGGIEPEVKTKIKTCLKRQMERIKMKQKKPIKISKKTAAMIAKKRPIPSTSSIRKPSRKSK